MASIQQKGNGWYCQFIYRGKRRTFAVGKVTKAEAEAKAAQVDYLLMRLEQRLIELPPGYDVVSFLKHDGTPPDAEDPAPKAEPTLGSLRDRYLETHEGSLEPHTLRGIRKHFRLLTRHFGESFHVRTLTLPDLQDYVNVRAKAKGRRGPLSPATIKKEIVTLRTAWNWGVKMKVVSGRYPYDGLRYPKAEEKPPFMTRSEIERQIPGLSPEKAAELWESLYLTLPEVERLLDYVRANAAHAWIYPLVATAAHTGARKGELLRMRVADVDFDAGVVTIKEKKRAHDRRTTRRVPLSTTLAAVLRAWLEDGHPGGSLLFAQAEVVERSKKRSPRTGYIWKNRPGPEKARMESVKDRGPTGLLPLTEEEAHHHLKQTLKGSEWQVVRGWHLFRHSFVSACASKGVDLRMLQEWCGHMSPEIQRRYLHLYPDVQAEALKGVFG